MKRRNFIEVIGLGAATIPALSSAFAISAFAADNNAKLVKPKALKAGDRVGLIAPATSVTDPDDIAKAIEAIKFLGLEPVLGKFVLAGSAYKTRSVSERLSDLHGFFADNTIAGVFAIRGGYGSATLLDKIDYDLLKKNPKVFIGYSDITAMHAAINKFSGFICYHGPVALSALPAYSLDYLKKAIMTDAPVGLIKNPEGQSGARKSYPIRTISPGKALGALVGGNLSIICSLMGTPYEIDTNDKILFLEEVGEEPYRIDRMLNQLKLAGKLKAAKGVVIGKCADCVQKNAPIIWDYTLGEVLDSYLSDLNIPVISGLMIGHTSEQATMPIGALAELNADLGEINVLE